MPSARSTHLPVTLRHRWTALLGIALVLWLNVLAVCPHAHEQLHAGDDPQHDEAGCVITQFANGQAESLAVPDFPLAPASCEILRVVIAETAPLAAPAHRLPPGCGPPRA